MGSFASMPGKFCAATTAARPGQPLLSGCRWRPKLRWSPKRQERMMTDTAIAAGKLPVLIIEDEPSVMSFVKAALERAGYSVMTAASGVEALPMLEQGEFLGVLSDMRTPGGVDGADVHAWLAA